MPVASTCGLRARATAPTFGVIVVAVARWIRMVLVLSIGAISISITSYTAAMASTVAYIPGVSKNSMA